MPETLMLIDGHSLAFRAFHGLPPTLTDRAGEPVNAVFGFLSMLFLLIQEQRPDYLAVVFDVGIPFRVELYDQYKAGRLEIDPAVERQVDRLRRVLEAMEIPCVAVEGYEADDIIKTLAEQAEAGGARVLVVTGDRDLFQVVSEHTSVLYLTRGVRDVDVFDPAKVEERYGVRPEQFRDYKALAGDASDNVPGVRGIGAKSAAQLLREYGTLGAIFAVLDRIEPRRTRNALAADGMRAAAELSARLVTLVEVPGISLDLARARIEYDRERARVAMEELGFKSLQARMP